MNELALFAGAGGGILGGKLLGWRTICAVEWDGYARDVLVARQNDGHLDPFPVWDDIQTFDGHPWRGRVDVISGGFPCQDISAAGKGAGIDGDRSSMWSHMARIIGEVRPRFVFVENSPLLVGRGLARVLGDLAEMGYDARWGVLGAHHVGAPHKRDRIWIMANSNSGGRGENGERGRLEEIQGERADQRMQIKKSDMGCEMADAGSKGLEGVEQSRALRDERNGEEAHGSVAECGGVPGPLEPCPRIKDVANAPMLYAQGRWIRQGEGEFGGGGSGEGRGNEGPSDYWATEPQLGRVAHGVAHRVDRLRCIGNGQVPAVAALAWNTLTDHRDHTADMNNEQATSERVK
tara:strand:- start:2681 stop:3727 length:1047 start_codon:yes stop_codon:yes gene_type:complete